MTVTVRNPLTVPVSEATPEELGVQARYHVVNASLNCLALFTRRNNTQAHDALRLIGSPVVTIRVTPEGDSMLDGIQALWLCELPDGGNLVVFRPHIDAGPDVPTGCTYGRLDPDVNVVRECTLEQIRELSDDDIIISAARSINDHILRAGILSSMRETTCQW